MGEASNVNSINQELKTLIKASEERAGAYAPRLRSESPKTRRVTGLTA